MSQEIVWKILRDNYPRYLSYADILAYGTTTYRNVFKALRRLLQYDEIEYKMRWSKNKKARWEKLYRAKRIEGIKAKKEDKE